MASNPILRGDIYWVNLDPTVGSEIKKKCPALVVSNNVANQFSPLVTIVPISSKTAKPYPFEVLLEAGTAGLKVNSLLKANQVRTVDKQRLIGSPLGTITDVETLSEIDQALKIHLALI